MAFKAQATDTTSNYTPSKKYLWRVSNDGNGQGVWRYVTTDAIGVIETAGYFTDTAFKSTVRAGDKIEIFVVGSISDARPITEDLRNDLVTYHEVFVIGDVGASATINVTPEIAPYSVEYSLP